MINGRLALGGLSLEFGKAKSHFDELAQRVDELAREERDLLTQERGIVEELARLYLPELSPESVSRGLVVLEEEMREALARQATHRAELAERLRELPEEIDRRGLLLAEAESAEDRVARELERRRAEIEAELAEDREHAAAAREHREVMERRSILKTRGARLQTVANVERHRYDANAVFSYLHRREYGRPGYRGRFLARWLDGWLARRIDYEALERKYRILRTGPHAIRAEIRALSEQAETLERTLDEKESAAAARVGLPAALEASETAQLELVAAREALDDLRATHDRLAAEVRAVDANRGRPYEEAVAMHEAFLESRSIHDLLRLASSTPDPRDDALTGRLDRVRVRLEAIADELAGLRERLEKGATRATSLGDLARETAKRFASRRSFFSEEFNLERLVHSVLEEGSDSGEALGRIAESHVTRPLLVSSSDRHHLDGLFAELSSRFDPELGAVSVRVEEGAELDSEVVVYDHHGRVLHRRVTRRRGLDG